MANTVARNGPVMVISAMDSDWDWLDNLSGNSFLNGIRLHSIQFTPGAADDLLIVRNGAIDGAIIVRWKCADEYDSKVFYCNGVKFKPYIDYSECTLSSGHQIVITQWTKPETV